MLFLFAVLGMNGAAGAAFALADINEPHAGEFRDLAIGEKAFYDPNGTIINKRFNLPTPLNNGTLDYWLGAYEVSRPASWQYGLLDFEVLTTGPN